MEFEWDDAKAAGNLEKHGVSFEVVYDLDWLEAITLPDGRFDYGEERYIVYGRSSGGDGYVVALTFRGDVRRIISVRPFGRREEKVYGRKNKEG